MANFDLSRLRDLPPPPPLNPRIAREEKIADDTRVESELNRFIASRQDALFNNPDAFYRTQGEDAIHASPVAIKNLGRLRDDLIDGLANDYQRQRLGAAIDAQMQLTRRQMARHVAEQSLVWQRGVAQDRIALLIKEAAHLHNDVDLVDGMSRAAANAARAHARVGSVAPGGPAEDAAAATARSSVLSSAIQTRLDRGDADSAETMLMRFNDDLDPAHAEPLQRQIETAQRVVDQPPQPIGDTPDAVRPGYFVLVPGPGPAGIEPGPQQPPAQSAPDQSPSPPAAPPEEQPDPAPDQPPETDSPVSPEPIPDERMPRPAATKAQPAASIALPQAGAVPEVPPISSLPAAMARLAPRVVAAASGAAGAAVPVLGSAAVATILFKPMNFQGGTIDLGDGLRARWHPEQQTATIERFVSKGLLGSEFGEKWEELPVAATYVSGADGYRKLWVDDKALKAALAAPAVAAGNKGVPPSFPPLPGAVPFIYQIRITLTKDGGTTIEHRSVTEEQIREFCPNYFRFKEIGSRAADEVRAAGLSDPSAFGVEMHKLAAMEINRISQVLLTEWGIAELRPEIGLLRGRPFESFQYRPKGSSILDVYEAHHNKKSVCIYDFKTGNAAFRKETRIRYAAEAMLYAEGYTHIYVMPIRIDGP